MLASNVGVVAVVIHIRMCVFVQERDASSSKTTTTTWEFNRKGWAMDLSESFHNKTNRTNESSGKLNEGKS